MTEHTGWLLDLYTDPAGITLWLLDNDGARRSFHHAFPVTFYVAGDFARLRLVWGWLRERAPAAQLRREQRRDLFNGDVDVLAVESADPTAAATLFGRVQARFPELDYYDADIPLPLRYAAAVGLFPLARCRLTADAAGRVAAAGMRGRTATVTSARWDDHAWVRVQGPGVLEDICLATPESQAHVTEDASWLAATTSR